MYKKLFLEWVTSSTVHGVPNIFRARTIVLGIMWSVFTLASVTYCIYTNIVSLILYAKYDTVINTDLKRDVPSTFPAVTICNLNTFDINNNEEYFEDLLRVNNLSSGLYVNDDTIETSYFSKSNSYILKEMLIRMKRAVANDKSLNDKLREKLGFSFKSQMLLSCQFNRKNCDASQFKRHWSNEYGNCYTFNSGIDSNGTSIGIEKTSRIGDSYGLQLELLIGDPNINKPFTDRQGIYLIVHDNKQPPFLTNGITVPTGFDTYIPFTRTVTKRLSKPYSDCVSDLNPFSEFSKKLFDIMKRLNVSQYSNKFCYEMCYQSLLVDNCNCSDLSLPVLENTAVCKSDYELDCLQAVNDVFSSSNLDTLCYHSCPDECNSEKFNLLDHKSTFPTDYYYSQLLILSNIMDADSADDERENNPYYLIIKNYGLSGSYDKAFQSLKNHIVKVTVNYDDLRYTYIEETPVMTFETLLGVLGGQLGLFIGISFLSFVEFIEIVIELTRLAIKKRRKHKAEKQQRNLNRFNVYGLNLHYQNSNN